MLRTSKYGGARRAALSVFEGLQGFFMGGEGGVRCELWKRVLPGTFSCFYHVALHSPHASEALRALKCVFVLLRHVFTPISLLTNTTDKQQQGANVLGDFTSLSALANSTQSSDEVENIRSSARLDIDEDDSCGSHGLSARLDEVLPSLLYYCRRSNRPRVRSSVIRGSSMLLQIKSRGDENDDLVLGPKSISAAFETLLVMRWDCIPDVAREAKEGLEHYRLSLSQKEWQELRSLSIDRILTICDALPHMVGSVSEDRLVQQLDLLASHVELLREDVGLVFKVGSTTVFNSLGKILELDMGAYASTGQGTLILENPPSSLSHEDSSLMEESSTTSSTASILYPTSYQRKYLLHCRESRTWVAIKRTLRTIGRYVDPKLLFDALEMHLFRDEGVSSIENGPKSSPGTPLVSRQAHLSWVKRGQSVCLVVAEALMGISSPSGPIPKQVLDAIVRTVLRSEAWRLPLSAHSSLFASGTLLSTTSLMTSDMVNANVVLVSLMLQVIGAAVTAAEKEALQDCMMELIYPLLEKATAEALQVKQAALCTLGRVAAALEIPDLRSLLRDHMDYIVDELVARLDEGPGGPEDEECLSTRYIQSGWLSSSSSSSYMSLSGVVLALLQYSGQHTMTPLLKDLKRAVLKQVDATWWSPDAAQANVAVMQALVESLSMRDVILASKTAIPGIREVNNIQEKMGEEGVLNGKDTWFKQLALDYGEPEGADQKSLKGVFDVEGTDNPDLYDFDDVLEEGHDTPREQHAKFVSSCPETVLLLDILDRCSLFINMPEASLSVDVATCVGVCWSKLAQLHADSVLLPSVHDLWPALIGRLSSIENLSTEGRFAGPPLLTAAGLNHERGGETCVLLALHPLLEIVSSLAGCPLSPAIVSHILIDIFFHSGRLLFVPILTSLQQIHIHSLTQASPIYLKFVIFLCYIYIRHLW